MHACCWHPQYLDVWAKAGVLLALPLGVIGVACACLLGSLWAAAIIVVVLASLLLHLMALMVLAGESRGQQPPQRAYLGAGCVHAWPCT